MAKKQRKQIAISVEAAEMLNKATAVYKAKLLKEFGLTNVTKFDVANFLIKKGYDAFMAEQSQPKPTPSTNITPTLPATPVTTTQPTRTSHSGRLEPADGDIFADDVIEVDTNHLADKPDKPAQNRRTIPIKIRK